MSGIFFRIRRADCKKIPNAMIVWQLKYNQLLMPESELPAARTIFNITMMEV